MKPDPAARPFFFEDNFWRLYRRLWRHVRPYWKLCVLSGVCMILMIGFLGGRIWIIKPLGDAIEKGTLEQNLNWILLFALAVTILRGVVRYTHSYLTRYIGHRSIRDLRNTVYNHVVSLSMSFYDQQKSGDLLSRLTGDITLVRQSVKLLFSEIFVKPLELFIYIGLMAWHSWFLTLMLLPCVPLISWIIRKISQIVKRFSRQQRIENAELYGMITESISGMRIIKAFNLENYHESRFADQTERLFQLTIRSHVFKAMSGPLMEVIIYSSVAIVAWVVLGFMKGMTLGDKGVFFLAAFVSFKPINNLTDIQYDIIEALAGAERVFYLLDQQPLIQNRPGAHPLAVPHESVEFENVSFAYQDELVLRNINLSTSIGKTIAFVGPSGAGKTTLINLLVRFYDPVEGRIRIDGHDLRDLQVRSLRSHMALVTQDPIIFNDTLWNNITCGRQEFTESEVHNAAKAAFAHNFISQLPNGYETVVGERGAKISGGERQRVAIARALLRNPSILLLDEATSSLDSESERIVQQALEHLMEGRTTFVVAHRLSTVVGADRIFVLDHGRIVEEGTHRELANRGGLYANLYETQMQVTAVSK
ncbi:MAG: ABC transporter ATP-binding protein [bacterium]